MLRGRRKRIVPGSGSSPTSGRPNSANLLRYLAKPFTLGGTSDTPHHASDLECIQHIDKVRACGVPTERDIHDATTSPALTKRKGVFSRLLPKSKPGKFDGPAQSTIATSVETCEHEEKSRTELLPSSTLKERVARLYDILSSSSHLPPNEDLEEPEEHLVCPNKLDAILEKTDSFQALPTFSPFAGCPAFGCNGADDSDLLRTPSKLESHSHLNTQHPFTALGSHKSTPMSDNLALDPITSPLLSALTKVADAFGTNPDTVPPLLEPFPAVPPEHVRSESYRLGYLLAHIGLIGKEDAKREPSSPGFADKTEDLRAVLREIRENAANDQVASNSLAFVAAEFAVISNGAIDREALELGYMHRVSELQRATAVPGSEPLGMTPDPALVKHSKKTLHAIENVLYTPYDPSKSEIMGVYWSDWSWLSSEDNDEKEVTAVETALSEMAKSTQDRGKSGGLVEMFSLFRKSEGSQTDESSESSESSSGSSSSSESSGVDISVATKPKGVSYVNRSTRKVIIDIDSTVESTSSEGLCTSKIGDKNAGSVYTEGSSILNASAACSTIGSDEESLPSRYALDKASLNSEPSVLSKQELLVKQRNRAITPYGFLSFIRAVSTMGTDSISTDDDHESDSHEAAEVGTHGVALEESTSSYPKDVKPPIGKRMDEVPVSSEVEPGMVPAQKLPLPGRLHRGYNAAIKGNVPTSLFRMPASSKRPPLAPARNRRHRKAPSNSQKDLKAVATLANESKPVNVTITKVHEIDSECIELITVGQEGFNEPPAVDDSAIAHVLPRFSIVATTKSSEDEVEVALADDAEIENTTAYDKPLKERIHDRTVVLQRSFGSTNTRNSTEAGDIEVQHQQQGEVERLSKGSQSAPTRVALCGRQAVSSDSPKSIPSYENHATTTRESDPKGQEAAYVNPAASRNHDDTSSEGSRHDFTGFSINQTDDSTRYPPSSLTPSRDSDAASHREQPPPDNENDQDDDDSGSQSETDTLATSDIASLLELLVGSGSEPKHVRDGERDASACEIDTVTHSEPGIVWTPSSPRNGKAASGGRRQRHRRSSSVPPSLLRPQRVPAAAAAPIVPAVE